MPLVRVGFVRTLRIRLDHRISEALQLLVDSKCIRIDFLLPLVDLLVANSELVFESRSTLSELTTEFDLLLNIVSHCLALVNDHFPVRNDLKHVGQLEKLLSRVLVVIWERSSSFQERQHRLVLRSNIDELKELLGDI